MVLIVRKKAVSLLRSAAALNRVVDHAQTVKSGRPIPEVQSKVWGN